MNTQKKRSSLASIQEEAKASDNEKHREEVHSGMRRVSSAQAPSIERAVTRDADFEIPTEHDLSTLRRVRGSIPAIAFSVAFVELCERFSYYGTTAVCERHLTGACDVDY